MKPLAGALQLYGHRVGLHPHAGSQLVHGDPVPVPSHEQKPIRLVTGLEKIRQKPRQLLPILLGESQAPLQLVEGYRQVRIPSHP